MHFGCHMRDTLYLGILVQNTVGLRGTTPLSRTPITHPRTNGAFKTHHNVSSIETPYPIQQSSNFVRRLVDYDFLTDSTRSHGFIIHSPLIGYLVHWPPHLLWCSSQLPGYSPHSMNLWQVKTSQILAGHARGAH